MSASKTPPSVPCALDPRDEIWKQVEDLDTFRRKEWTDCITKCLSVYGADGTTVDPERKEAVEQILRQTGHFALKRLKNDLVEHLNGLFIGDDKREIIKMAVVCAIAQQPMLIIGPPGSAKSRILTRLCEGLGIARTGIAGSSETCYQYCLHSFTEPEEVLGVLDLIAFKDGRFERLRKGSITDAEVIFLDELFKAPSALLNALLTIVNERRVYEGGTAVKTKARIIFGASNAIPGVRQMEELRAFYERFFIRLVSTYVPMGNDETTLAPGRDLLLRQGWKAEVAELRAGYDPQEASMKPKACLNDILLLNRAITELWGGENLTGIDDGLLYRYHEAVARLSSGDAPPALIDDRKFIRLFAVVRAHALFRGFATPSDEDLTVLKHTWNDPADRQRTSDIIETVIRQSPLPPGQHS